MTRIKGKGEIDLEIDISGAGISFGLFCIGAGLALMGNYIGKGLMNFRQSKNVIDYNVFLKESDLAYVFKLNRNEIKALLTEHQDVPKLVLNGTTYYPKNQLIEWISSKNFSNE